IIVYIKGDSRRAAECEYTPEGETLVNHYLEIVIEDSGTGIPESQLALIFDTYYHTAHTNSMHMESSGLGLSIAKGIVEKHHGFIKAESQIGTGSRFIVALPFGKAHLTQNQLIAHQIDIEDISQYPGGDQLQLPTDEEQAYTEPSYTLLIVEDHAALLHYLSEVFATSFRVITAKNGVEGIEKAKQHFPDLIISDVMMPEMDGLEMCKKLKND